MTHQLFTLFDFFSFFAFLKSKRGNIHNYETWITILKSRFYF